MANPATGRDPYDRILSYNISPAFREPPAFVQTPAADRWAAEYLQRRTLLQNSINDMHAEADKKIFDTINAVLTDEQKEEGRMINLRNQRKVKNSISELELDEST